MELHVVWFIIIYFVILCLTRFTDFDYLQPRFTKRCASLNTMLSLLWWMVGFYWVVSGGDILLQDAPRLYW